MSFVIPFIFSFLITIILTPLVIVLAHKFKLIDDPKVHEHPAILHKKIIPRTGGILVFCAFVFTALIMVPFSKQLLGIILGGLILVGVGILDDRRDIKQSWKLLGQILAALVVVASGVGISFITNPFHLFGAADVIRLDSLRISFEFLGRHSIVVWADLFALFWVVWVINMINFSAGIDGQMPGVVFISLMVIFLTSLKFIPGDKHQLIVSHLALIGGGTTLAFLIFNFYPAKIFPGDSGSYFLGFLVAVLAILSGAKVGTAILVMTVPLVDGVFTVIRRIVSGKSPFAGDRKHLHHMLFAFGWGQRKIALFYWALCAILGAAALLLSANEKVFAGVVVATFLLGGLLWLNFNLPAKAQK